MSEDKLIPIQGYKGKKAGVFGLARTGLSTVQALVLAGAEVVAWDDNPERCKAARSLGARIEDLSVFDISDFEAIVVSPGVPLTHPAPHPVVAHAQSSGVRVIGDTELFAQALKALPPSRIVVITGTNGKSTTTALIGHMLKSCGRKVAVAGNIGRPVLDLEPLPEDGIYVLEMSSYQIDLTRGMAADISVLLNISPDHLDRHGDLHGYVAAKKRLLDMQHQGQIQVIGIDDKESRALAHGADVSGRGIKVVPVSAARNAGRGISVVDGILYDGLEGVAIPIGNLVRAQALVGQHNWQNAAAAYAVGRSLGLEPTAIFGALVSFPGLAHRMELVASCSGVKFVNDSKATNVEAASRALGSFENIFWIAGGKPKSNSLEELAPLFPRIRKAFLIGEAAPAFEASLAGRVPVASCGTMDIAVANAAAEALASGLESAVVLLSPACASFDQFKDFEQRGDTFSQLARDFVDAHCDVSGDPPRRAGGNGA